jgi:hypothetical protein
MLTIKPAEKSTVGVIIAVSVIAVVGCIVAHTCIMICVVWYKKRVRPPSTVRTGSECMPRTSPNLRTRTQHPLYQLRPSNVHSASTTLQEPSRLRAATHADEAPPTYLAAMHYKTMTPEDDDLKLSEGSAVYRPEPGPPTYSEVIDEH